MTLQEILLIVVVLALLLLPILLARYVKQPIYTYSVFAINVLVLILVWGFAGDGSLPLRIIVTVFVIKNTAETLKKYKVFSN